MPSMSQKYVKSLEKDNIFGSDYKPHEFYVMGLSIRTLIEKKSRDVVSNIKCSTIFCSNNHGLYLYGKRNYIKNLHSTSIKSNKP